MSSIPALIKRLGRALPPRTAVVLVVAVFYGGFTLVALGLHHWDPLWFAWLGEKYLNLDLQGRVGYDGQFVYYIARDGLGAIPHLDNPPYRLQRIVLPLIVRCLSLGQPALIPWIVVLVNFAAIVWTTHLLSGWLSQNGVSSWYAAVYALYVGAFMAYSRDLVEPLALFFVTGAAVLWFRKRFFRAIVLLSLAILTKEIMALFALGLLIPALAKRRYKLAILAAAAFVPFVLWEVYLFSRFATLPIAAGPSLEKIPLWGILPHVTLEPGRISGLLFVALPALLLLPVSLSLLKPHFQSPAVWWLLLHSAFVLVMPFNVYDHIMHAGRNAGGLVIAALFVFPCWGVLLRRMLAAMWILPTLIWVVPVLRWSPWLATL